MSCANCPEGYYSSTPGQLECLPCPPGMFTLTRVTCVFARYLVIGGGGGSSTYNSNQVIVTLYDMTITYQSFLTNCRTL